MNKDLQTIYTRLSVRKANLILLILTSQNIESHTQKTLGLFDISVNTTHVKSALAAIENYHKENKFSKIKKQIQEISISSFFSITTFIIMGILCAIHAFSQYYNLHENMILTYGSSALYIFQGETYRGITALFLHADGQHLLGNMAGLLIFGAPVIRISGYGTGPFMLLFCGTIGNLINAHLHQNAHLSIGASTSIMAAAGLLCTFKVIQKNRPFKPRTLLPIFSGATMVALFSQGENTDVWAHILGFFCGLVSGIVFFPLNQTIQSPKKHSVALITAVIIIIAAGLAAIK